MTLLINDKYRRRQGGHARLFKISCTKCSQLLFDYQKDAPGIFKRLYFDRIKLKLPKKPLLCAKCKALIGVPYIYEKENRPAIKLFVGAISKKLIKE